MKKQKRCPSPRCRSTELMSMGRQHGLGGLKLGWAWVLLFPAMPLLLLQAPLVMKCDACGKSFIQKSAWQWVWRGMLALTLGFWTWVLVEVVRDAVG